MRLTSGGTNVTGVWSPDGKQIAYSSNKDGDFNLFIGPSDGNIPARQVTARQSWDFPTSWSPDGKTIAVVEQYRATLADIYTVAPQGPTTPTALLATPFAEHAGVFSPDGRWLAYQSNESGRYEIYVLAYPSNGRKSMVSATGGTNPVWKRDGTELFYRSGPRMMAVPTRLSPNFTAGKPAVLFRGDFDEPFDVTPDGRRFIMVKRPPQSPRTRINVVLGGFDHLK
jgi:Tol biopolymer transport system component